MKRWLAVAAAGLGVLGAGCSAPGQPPAAPPPPPPPAPTKEGVAWAQRVCTTVKELDATLSKPASQATPRYLAAWIKELRAVKPTGVAAADGYAAELGKSLESASSDPQAALAQMEPQQLKLTIAAEKFGELTASYNAAPACTPVGKPEQSVPSRDMVLWANVMCLSHYHLSTLRTDPLNEPALSDPRFAQAAAASLSLYIRGAGDPLDDAIELLATAQPIGIADADSYRTTLLAAVRAAKEKMPESGTGMTDLMDMPADQLKAKATEIATALTPAKPKDADLRAIVAKNPPLTAAHSVAPACDAPGDPLPAAANGTDVAACASGKCQVQITGSADVTAAGSNFRVVVRDAKVTVTDATGVVSLGGGGVASFGNGQKTVTIQLRGAKGNTAVLDITAT
ncbi:hypothetical protein [Kibdelosporangium phytohabitans]|uniref:Ig-like domain-containing protein n=1 Tax=Kibdelosporangium phytohabitans TaxID=860235 RepID=A0A0N9HW50_9PSEU|nr:hypothetical protein [Kibdelosporangium phytohabitans]ALG09498.1 hypothetical protein AOZ06_23625 [Kibdelosporangium phytohabitans]MBE1469202.1 hypothetical protein [Kibdelosporangium phytohabitans]